MYMKYVVVSSLYVHIPHVEEAKSDVWTGLRATSPGTNVQRTETSKFLPRGKQLLHDGVYVHRRTPCSPVEQVQAYRHPGRGAGGKNACLLCARHSSFSVFHTNCSDYGRDWASTQQRGVGTLHSKRRGRVLFRSGSGLEKKAAAVTVVEAWPQEARALPKSPPKKREK